MKITTKENANGRVTAYFVDGVKVRKNEINGIISSRRKEIIEINSTVAQQFTSLTRSPYRNNLKIVFTDSDIFSNLRGYMTEAAAIELGATILRTSGWAINGFNGLFFYNTKKIDATKLDASEYAITPEAFQVAVEAEIALTNNNIGDLTDRALAASNSRLAAFSFDAEKVAERKEAKKEKYQCILTVRVPQLHPYRKFDVKNCLYYYKSLDAVKRFGDLKVKDYEWKIETIDGEVIAKGAGTADFDNFFAVNTGTYSLEINGEFVRFENHSIVYNDDDTVRNLIPELDELNDIDSKQEEEKMTMETKNELPTGKIEVTNGADAFTKVAPYFRDGLKFVKNNKGYNREDVFSFTNDDVIYLVVTCTPDNRRVECLEVLNTNESGSKRKLLTVVIKPESQQADDFAAKVAELKANADAAKAVFEEKLAELEKAKSESFDADHALEKFYNDAAYALWEMWNAAFGIKRCIEIVKQSGYGRSRPTLSDVYIDGYSDSGQFRIVDYRNNPYAIYETPAQVEKVIGLLRAAIKRGDKEFTFPTVEELSAPIINPDLPADDFDYTAAKEHIENVYADIQNCIDIWSHKHGLTQAQCEKIYIALHVNADFNQIDATLRDELIQSYKHQNSLTRAMQTALEKFQDSCKLGDLTAANREMACYQICRTAIRELLISPSVDSKSTIAETDGTEEEFDDNNIWKLIPAPDELNDVEDDSNSIDDLNDSLIRGMKQSLKKIQSLCLYISDSKRTDLTAINYEWQLYNIQRKALFERSDAAYEKEPSRKTG